MTQRRRHRWWLVSMLLAIMPACAWIQPQEPVASKAFFVAAPKDAAIYRELAREQDAQLASCAAAQSCDRVHFMRALTALYENQEVALKHFQRVIAIAPNGRYAASSLQWVKLLQAGRSGTATHEEQLMQATQRLVRDLLERETEIQVSKEAKDAKFKADSKNPDSVQALKKELKVRDMRIDELTEQIEALKRVDQEVKEKTRVSKP